MNRGNKWAGPHNPTGPTPEDPPAPTLSELYGHAINLTPHLADGHFTRGRLQEFGPMTGHAAARLPILQNGSITIQGVFEPAQPLTAYWPETYGTAVVTRQVPINRWHRVLARLSRHRGLRWIKARTRPVTLKLDNVRPWPWTGHDHDRT